MKRMMLLLAVMITCVSMYAQSTQKLMNFYKDGSLTDQKAISAIDSINFSNMPLMVLVSPANGGVSVLPATLIWTAFTGAASYTLQVSTNNLFSSFVYNQSGLTGTSQAVEGLSLSTTYYWRVQAHLSYNSQWSEIWSFTTWTTNPMNGFTLVQGGSFTMGSSSGETVEIPLHSVTLNSFYISQYEVTQGKWKTVMGGNPSNFPSVGDSGPVELVTWYECISFCNKLSIIDGKTPCYSINGDNNPVDWASGQVVCSYTAKGYRLPTEAEWEYAARGGNQNNGYDFSGSNTLDIIAWNLNNSGNTTHIVGTRTSNELGIFDMSGNVWEWTWDWFGLYGSTSQINPTGSTSGIYHTIRGGCFNSVNDCRVSKRGSMGPGEKRNFLGFRLVVDQ